MSSGFLLDTNVISEFLRVDQNPDPNVERWLDSIDPDFLFTSAIVCGEIQKGIEKLGPGKRRSDLFSWLSRDVHQWFGSRILPVDFDVAVCWGRLTIKARTRGIQAPLEDALIAASAVHHGLTLATRNERHFVSLGVTVLNPWKA